MGPPLHTRPSFRHSKALLVAIADCAHGVGEHLVDAFMDEHHCRVIGASPSREKLYPLMDRYQIEIQADRGNFRAIDIASPHAVKSWLEATEGTFGPVDILITNMGCLPLAWSRPHGRGVPHSFLETPDEDWARFREDLQGARNMMANTLHQMTHPRYPLVGSTHLAPSKLVMIPHSLNPTEGADTTIYKTFRAASDAMMTSLGAEFGSKRIMALTADPGTLASNAEKKAWAEGAATAILNAHLPAYNTVDGELPHNLVVRPMIEPVRRQY